MFFFIASKVAEEVTPFNPVGKALDPWGTKGGLADRNGVSNLANDLIHGLD
jgi:hypothetical protein